MVDKEPHSWGTPIKPQATPSQVSPVSCQAAPRKATREQRRAARRREKLSRRVCLYLIVVAVLFFAVFLILQKCLGKQVGEAAFLQLFFLLLVLFLLALLILLLILSERRHRRILLHNQQVQAGELAIFVKAAAPAIGPASKTKVFDQGQAILADHTLKKSLIFVVVIAVFTLGLSGFVFSRTDYHNVKSQVVSSNASFDRHNGDTSTLTLANGHTYRVISSVADAVKPGKTYAFAVTSNYWYGAVLTSETARPLGKLSSLS